MAEPLRIAYFAHSLRSDWNNGNAHFLRGLLRSMQALGHQVTVFEPDREWSIDHLREEPRGEQSLTQFSDTYSELDLQTYGTNQSEDLWRERLRGFQIVLLHEWNAASLAHRLLRLRPDLGFRLLFHDTHHRASSSPQSFAEFGLAQFDGVIAFGAALARLYRERFHLEQVWTLHEAADISIFHPLPHLPSSIDGVWIGNWGDGERSAEIERYFLAPAAQLRQHRSFRVFGVRYPEDGLRALARAGVAYGGYLPNLSAPAIYARSRLTIHIPRQQYAAVMTGIPTIRVFEALASGIPLLSAPWQDTEQLFRPGDFRFVTSTAETVSAFRELLNDSAAADAQAQRGLETVLARHTCAHRARELTQICQRALAVQETYV